MTIAAGAVKDLVGKPNEETTIQSGQFNWSFGKTDAQFIKKGVTIIEWADLIKDEFEAIDGYSSSLATLKILENDGSDYSGIIANLEDIKNEELIHVGQLQKCLAEVNPKAEAIDDGKEEASETIAVAEEESAKGEEPAVEA